MAQERETVKQAFVTEDWQNVWRCKRSQLSKGVQ